NYVACKTAKQLLEARRCIATVINPKNVEVFRRLGVDSVVCSTYLLSEQIRSSASVENLINSLSLEDNKIIILELRITEGLSVQGKTLKDINISNLGSVSAIMRADKTIIPNGNTELLDGDKVLVVTSEENRNRIVNLFQRKRK
ncbi:MAG: TrkA family potassium uptake protein, partial [Erysipelotrichaceae bacterium]|nr:TrkA family potassium uptake protein [Erysipelotrichaceae bacterium]